MTAPSQPPAIRPGSRVRYYPEVGKPAFFETHATTPAYARRDGTVVVGIAGLRAPAGIDAVRVLPPPIKRRPRR